MRVSRIAKIAIVLMLALAALPLANSVLLSQGPENTSAAQGNGNGNQNRSDVAKEKAKNDKKDKDKKDKNTPPGQVVLVEPYTIEVDCVWESVSDQTECVISGTAPEDGKDIGFIQILEGDVCAPVVSSDGDYASPEPHTRVPGYKSKEDKASLSLVMQGEVQVAGTATYWIKAGGAVFPATGPGLECLPDSLTLTEQTPATTETKTDPAPTAAPSPTAEPTAAPEPAGTLNVFVYLCTDVPENTTDYDWFGACHPDSNGHTASVESTNDPAGDPRTAETDETGKASFEALPPATYTLSLGDNAWCHAKSDRVNPDSTLIVEDGQETSVYIFMCDVPSGS